MPNAPFHWTPEALVNQASEWVINLEDMLLEDFNVIVEMEAALPIRAERWWSYKQVEWRTELDQLSERISNLVFRQTGVALLKCSSRLTADQARLIQLILGSQFGINVTTTAEGNDRPLFAVKVKADPTANGRYAGNAMKRNQIGFHTDGSGSGDREINLLSMLCIRPARFGGQSCIANSQLAYEWLPRTAREILQEPVPRQNPYEPNREAQFLKRVPIFQRIETVPRYVCFSYHPERVRNGVRQTSGSVSRELEEAFRSLEGALEKFSCEINLAANEILFLNNRVVAHDRRPFWDDPRAPRLLERFWAGALSYPYNV